mgnify:CR=1 FL=1
MKECKARIASLALDGPIVAVCSDFEGCLKRRIDEGRNQVQKGEVFEGECYTEEGPQGQRSLQKRDILAKAQREIWNRLFNKHN